MKLCLNHRTALIALLAGILLLWGCQITPKVYDPSIPESALVLLPPDEWPALADDMDYDGLTEAIDQSLTLSLIHISEPTRPTT